MLYLASIHNCAGDGDLPIDLFAFHQLHEFQVKLARVIEDMHKALCIQSDRKKWKFKYDISLGMRHVRTKIAAHKLDHLDDDTFNVILQIGAWFNLTGRKNKRTVTYQDGNIQTLLHSPFSYPRISHHVLNRVIAYEKKVYQNMDYIFARSQWLADSFVKDFGVDPSRVSHPVGAGINLPYVKDITGKTYESPHILFVGREFERKGGLVLLEAFKEVRKIVKNATLTIVGSVIEDPPVGVMCIDRIEKNTEEGIEQLLRAYASASIFVMPSLYEPYGIVFAEASAHRLPCIGTNTCAMPEIIDDGLTGFIVPVNEPSRLAKRMIELLSNPAQCKEMGERGYQKYRAQYRWEVVAQKIIERLNK